MLFRVGPRLLGAAPGGHLADRYGAQPVVSTLLVVQGAFTVALLVAVNNQSTVGIYVAVALAQLVGAAIRPLFPALVGIHTPPANRGRFNAIDQIVYESSLFIAPALGAALLAWTSVELVIAVDCATFLVAAALAVTLPRTHPGGIATSTIAHGAAAGFRFVWSHRALRVGATGLLTSGATVTLLQSVLVVAAAERYGGAGRIGYFYTAVGIGGVAGGLLGLRMHAKRIRKVDIYTTALFEIAPIAVLSIVQSFPAALVLLVISGVSGTLNWTFTTTYMQNNSPSEIISRVSAALDTANFFGMVIGAVVALTLATLVGWPELLLGFAVACILFLTAATIGQRDRPTSVTELSGSGSASERVPSR
jgi:MFS family permease